jgi:hypothetical protein
LSTSDGHPAGSDKEESGAMATTQSPTGTLQEQAQRHLWMHFSRMGAYGPEAEIPIIVRGEGCHVWDEHGSATSTASARCSA